MDEAVKLRAGDALLVQVEARVSMIAVRDHGASRTVARRIDVKVDSKEVGPGLFRLNFADEIARAVANTSVQCVRGSDELKMSVRDATPENMDPWIDATTERENIVRWLRRKLTADRDEREATIISFLALEIERGGHADR